MVEGGATLNWGLISNGLVDEIYTFIGNIILGGKTAPTLVDGEGGITVMRRLELISLERLEDGVLIKWKSSTVNFNSFYVNCKGMVKLDQINISMTAHKVFQPHRGCNTQSIMERRGNDYIRAYRKDKYSIDKCCRYA